MSRTRVFSPSPDAAPPPRSPAPPAGGSNQSLIMAIIVIVLVTGGFVLWSVYGAPPAQTAPVIEAPEGAYKERFTGAQEEQAPPTADIDQALQKGAAPEAPPVQAVAPAKASAPAASVTTAPAAGAEYVVQIAALQSEAAANAAWTRLSGKDPALFASAKKDIQRADLGQKGVYFRVRAGYFTDRTEASRFCARVKSGGQDCIVVAR